MSPKSKMVNDFISQAKEQQAHINLINNKLEKAEISGFTNATKEDILSESKSRKTKSIK